MLPLRVRLLPLGAGAALCALLLGGCGEGSVPTVAKVIEQPDELIGGPSAKGKVGDYLLANDQVRAVVAGEGQSWVGSTFGGSLIDVDRVRAGRRDERYGMGWDAFGESFPLVNLIIPDPLKPLRRIDGGDDGLQVQARVAGIRVLKDGSDGEAVVRVEGAGAYLFQAIKYLNRDFLFAQLQQIRFGSSGLRDLAPALLDPNLDLYSLLNRLQLDFNFRTDYILRDGERWVTIRSTVEIAPPSDERLALCTPDPTCKLSRTDCPNGFVLQESSVRVPGETKAVPIACPICACAEAPQRLVPFTEQRSIFGDMLGDLDLWVQPDWRGGILGGDFLMFGGDANIFIPGLGFDEQRRIFENMWQGVGSLASPLVFPWVAGVGENVSYAFTSVNPQRRPAEQCAQHRLAIVKVAPEGEELVAEALQRGFGFTKGAAEGQVRGYLVDRNPIVLPVPALSTADVSASELDAWRREAAHGWWEDAVDSWGRAEDEPAKVAGLPALAEEDLRRVQASLEQFATLGLLPAAECQPAQMLVPLFTTGATAIMTHEDLGELEAAEGGVRHPRAEFTWERYLAVGDGDVASALEPVFELRREPVGWVKGVVIEDGSSTPIRHASVFVVRDPRTGAATKDLSTWAALKAANAEAYGNEGIVSQMQTDRGLDPVHDGDFSGPLPPGNYYLLAKTKSRGVSRPVPFQVRAGQTETVHLSLQPAGLLSLRIFDGAGQQLPAKAVVVDIDEEGKELTADGRAEVALGDSRYDLGIRRSEFSVDGTLDQPLEPGRYRLYVTRGVEYSMHRQDIELKPGKPLVVEATLWHEVDTSGHVSADFHVHAQPSVDSSMPLEERVAAAAAEGLEFVTGTDHDALTDYRPTILDLGLESFVASQIGVETSTLEFGHFNGFPMKYDRRDWSVHDPPPWFGLDTQEVFDAMRARSNGPQSEFVVQVNHPFDGFMGYFAQAGVRGYDLDRKTPGLEMCNPQTEQISCDFDAVEILNEKRFELVRTPTVQEVSDYNTCYQEILAEQRPARFVLPDGGDTADDVVCGELQSDPPGCATVTTRLSATGLSSEARARLLSERDRCGWTRQMRRGFERCAEPGISIIACKRAAIDGLKGYAVRRMLDRDPREQDAFFAMTELQDPGCKLATALQGCSEQRDADGELVAGCGKDCVCAPCVCEAHPECCKAPDEEGGTGWTQACADVCQGECFGCGVQPCTERTQMLDAWFGMLNQGFEVTGVGNSDSHGRMKEVGLPRNFLRVGSDDVQSLDAAAVNAALRAHKVSMSTGPYVTFSLDGAEVGDHTALAQGSDKVRLRVRVQTASWFGVDWVEVYRNGRLERRLRVEKPVSAIVDFDDWIELPRPSEDSWYVVMTYGLTGGRDLSPSYGSLAYGHLLIPTIIGVGLPQILGSFDSLMAKLDELAPMLSSMGIDLQSLIASAAGSVEMPDNFPTLPLAITNPIWVDVDGGGYTPPEGRDADGDGQLDPPAFCAKDCPVELDEAGLPGRSNCGTYQVCRPLSEGASQGRCTIPVPAACPPDVFATGNSGASLMVGAGQRAGLSAEPPWSATRLVEGMLRRQFLGKGH